MDTAVGKIAVHTVNLRQVLGTADRADIHVEFLVAAVIAVSQGQVDALVVAELHCTLDQRLDRAFVVADRIAHVLDFSAVAELPETSLEILFLDRGDVLGYVAVDRIEDAVLFLKLGNLVVDIFQRIECELSVLNKRFSVVQLLQLVQRRDAERCGHRL